MNNLNLNNHNGQAIMFSFLKTVVVSLLFLFGCSPNDNLTGTGSQAGNGRVACVIFNEDGSPAVGASIRLRSRDYIANHDTSFIDTVSRNAVTDKNGAFIIDSVDSGSYFIEANDGNSHAVLLSCEMASDDTILKLPEATLLPTGTIKGTFTTRPDGSKALSIQIYGLERSGVYDSTSGEFYIFDVPGGKYTIRIHATSSTSKPVEIPNVTISPDNFTNVGSIDFIRQSTWLYSQNIYINTTSTGADIAANVTNFPLLLRLRQENFVFNNAKNDGSDIRFTKSNGASLCYEIERWDAAEQEAEIWVKIDTIYGNNSIQHFMMYWGNPDASDSSNSTTVFDTSNGFTGVWHLGETDGKAYDATGNSFNGKDSGSTTASGMIGNARKFTNKSHIKIPGLLNTPSNVTLSAWAQCDTSTLAGQEIISLGDAVLIRMDDNSGMGTLGSFFYDSANYIATNNGKFYAKTGWHHLAYSFDFKNHFQTFFIDGVPSATTSDSNSIHYANLGTDTYIGIHGNKKQSFYFNGRIDEVRVNNTAVSADYIKLCFMNQRVDDKLVVYR
ncbi:MAG TPA: DUF2341 domain-containing protein [Chitinispirillaceae bacterium]|nr:DUF2341 domain-containing protein [Chitinispirillaceae bacterium]